MAKPYEPEAPADAAGLNDPQKDKPFSRLLRPFRWVWSLGHFQLPLRWADGLNHFLVETRLIFSRSIILLVAALFIGFLWFTIQEKVNKEDDVYFILLFQGFFLAILLNMNLWESERESHAFELLIMRIPNVNRLIWFKLRVSLGWAALLSLPFFAGFAFFVGIPLPRLLGYYVYCLMAMVLVALLTCIASSFVHHGLTAAIITVIAVYGSFGFLEGLRQAPFGRYFQIFRYPFQEDLVRYNLTILQNAKWIILNRLIMIAAIIGMYAWLRRRLMKTEKWIG